jgi:hypothetical protein
MALFIVTAKIRGGGADFAIKIGVECNFRKVKK